MLLMRDSILHTGSFFYKHHDSCAVSLHSQVFVIYVIFAVECSAPGYKIRSITTQFHG